MRKTSGNILRALLASNALKIASSSQNSRWDFFSFHLNCESEFMCDWGHEMFSKSHFHINVLALFLEPTETEANGEKSYENLFVVSVEVDASQQLHAKWTVNWKNGDLWCRRRRKSLGGRGNLFMFTTCPIWLSSASYSCYKSCTCIAAIAQVHLLGLFLISGALRFIFTTRLTFDINYVLSDLRSHLDVGNELD